MEEKRYRWTVAGTNLLVSIWSNEQIQNQLNGTCRIQPIWNSIGKYMTKKGFPVSGLQCRTRIKNMTRQYQEAVTSGNIEAIDSYFEVFHKIISEKAKAREEKAKLRTSQDTASEKSAIDNTEIDVLEEVDEPSGDEQPAASDEAPFCSVESTQLEALINNAAQAQTQVIRQLLNESMHSIERLIKAESEKVLRVVAEEAERRRELERKLDRLLTKVEAMAAPPLTYMGT